MFIKKQTNTPKDFTEEQRGFIQFLYLMLEQIEKDPNFSFSVHDFWYGEFGDSSINIKLKWRRKE